MEKNYIDQRGGLRAILRAQWFRGLLLLAGLGLQGAVATAQTQGTLPLVTLNVKEVAISEVFKTIKAQTDYSVVYNVSDVNPNRKISLVASDESLTTVLDRIFAGTNVAYTINDKHIVLSIKPQTQSQDGFITVTGRVVDTQGTPLPGATVLIVGTTMGVPADASGTFSIQASRGDMLEASCMGYLKKQVAVTGSGPLSIALAEGAIETETVVVTALGIKRESKSLPYNAQTVGGDATTKVKDASFINALAGKIAGAQITQSASGAGGSTRVVLRGTKSLFGANDALYVVDGVPLAQMKTEQPNDSFETPDGGDGDGIADLNPDDIESMTVLTGAAASALYGNLGANGVIVITTKRGKAGETRVSISNSTTFQSPFVKQRFQNTYGSEIGSYYSWGQKLATPTSYDPNDFFQTGFEVMNVVGVSTGSQRNQTYLSVGSTNSRGLLPNSKYNRYNFTLRNSAQLIPDKLTLDASIMYILQSDQNRLLQGQYHNPLLPIYLFPRGDDINKYKLYERFNPSRNMPTQFWPYGDLGLAMENPYWIVNREFFTGERKRFLGIASLNYKITDWINVTGRWSYDTTQKIYERKISASSSTLFASECGDYLKTTTDYVNNYGDAIVNFNKSVCDFNFTANLGGSYMDQKMDMIGYEGHLLTVPNLFDFSNIDKSHAEAGPKQDDTHIQIQSLFATFNVGYKGMAYLDLSARNDWSSALAFTKSTSIFYPSVGASFVLSEMFNLSAAKISFLKLRGSYSEVGAPPPGYITSTSYAMKNSKLQTLSFIPATGLLPARTKAYEAGITLKMFRNRVNLDFTAYKSNTYDQLFDIPLSASSGYSNFFLNAGNVRNRGIEASLTYKDTFGKLEWQSTATYSINENKIIQLIPDGTVDPTTGFPIELDELVVSETGTYRMTLKEGGSMSDIYVSGLRTDYNGFLWVDPQAGSIAIDSRDKWYSAGSAAPRYTLGWNNSFGWKGVELSFLIDARIGGIGVSSTQAIMDRFGVSEITGKYRDGNGVPVHGGYVNPEYYYAVVGSGTTGVLSNYVYDATNVRLRELSLGYTLPSKWFGDKLNATVSLIGRNLFMFYNKCPFDPQLTASTGTYYQGYDYFMAPSTRSMGFSVKIQF